MIKNSQYQILLATAIVLGATILANLYITLKWDYGGQSIFPLFLVWWDTVLLICSALFHLFRKSVSKDSEELLPHDKEWVQQYTRVANHIQKETKTGMWWFDIKTEHVEWTPNLKRIYEKPKNWTVDLAEIDAMVSDESREHYDAHTQSHRHGQSIEPFDYKVNTKSGIKILRAIIIPTIKNGEVVQIYGSVQDVTEEIRAAESFKLFNLQLQVELQQSIGAKETERLLKRLEI